MILFGFSVFRAFIERGANILKCFLLHRIEEKIYLKKESLPWLFSERETHQHSKYFRLLAVPVFAVRIKNRFFSYFLHFHCIHGSTLNYILLCSVWFRSEAKYSFFSFAMQTRYATQRLMTSTVCSKNHSRKHTHTYKTKNRMWTIKTDLCRNGAAWMLRMFVAACGRYLSPNNFWFFIDFVSNKNENLMNKARSSSYIHVKYIDWKLDGTNWSCVHEINRYRCCFRPNRGVNVRRAHGSPYIVWKFVSDKLTHIFHWKWSV